MLTTVKNELQRATPESQGIASSAILKFVEAVESQIHELHSFMLLRHGKVVAEGWWSPYGRDLQHMLFSLSKSFTSTAVGLAVNEGRLSVDDKVLSFFPDDAPTTVSDNLAAMKVRHLLSMSTGHDVDTMQFLGPRADGNWTKAFLEVPVLHKPGTHFVYNTGATYMLAAIVQKVTGMMLTDYLEPRLFAPLGIEKAWWEVSPQEINMGGFGLNIKTEDIARFGQLYLQKGVWQGQQLVPEAWVKEATAIHSDNSSNTNIDWQQGYGYQFWRCRHNAYRGDGAFGQYCVVMPDQDAVLAITSGLGDMQEPLNLVWDILLPAMKDDPLPDDAAAQDKLTAKLSSLKFSTVNGEAASTISARIYGQVYQLDANELGFETVSLNVKDDNWTLSIKKAGVEERVSAGYQVWRTGETSLFNQPFDKKPAKIVASAAWGGDMRDECPFYIRIRFNETPFYQTIVLHFARTEDKLTLESTVNVGFEPPQMLVVVGHPVS